MRLSCCVVALVAASLVALSIPAADARGFGWFFAHSKPQGNCSGQSVVATSRFITCEKLVDLVLQLLRLRQRREASNDPAVARD